MCFYWQTSLRVFNQNNLQYWLIEIKTLKKPHGFKGCQDSLFNFSFPSHFVPLFDLHHTHNLVNEMSPFEMSTT